MIPMLNLVRQQDSIREQLRDVVVGAMDSARYLPSARSEEPATPLEQKLSRYCGRRYAVGVGSGTAAIHLALLAAGVGAGDEVLTVPNTFFATIEAILHVGARPVFVDIAPGTHLMDPSKLDALLGPRTKAVLPVHLYGNVVDVEAIQALLERRGRSDVVIVEDCAHAAGAWIRDRPVPVGAIGAFSFNPTKNIGGLGDGGAVVTDLRHVAEGVRLLSNHGRAAKDAHVLVGFNSRLGCVNDHVIALKMDYLDEWNDRRRSLARRYDEAFDALPGVTPVRSGKDVRSSYHQYVLCLDDRDAYRRHLAESGITTAIHYPELISEQPALKAGGHLGAELPVATRLVRRIVSIPCYAELHDAEQDQIISATRKFFAVARRD